MKQIRISLNNVWDLAVNIANERYEQKKGYETHLPLSQNYELVGVLGELLFSLVIQKSMDTRLLPMGDDGFDFERVNINGPFTSLPVKLGVVKTISVAPFFTAMA